MKEIKYLLNSLFWAAYTSSWWVAIKWGYDINKDTCYSSLWVIPTISTIIILCVGIAYCIANWDNK